MLTALDIHVAGHMPLKSRIHLKVESYIQML